MSFLAQIISLRDMPYNAYLLLNVISNSWFQINKNSHKVEPFQKNS